MLWMAGGTSGLGLLAAAWLGEAGARSLLLLGRSGRAPGPADAATLAALGGPITGHQAGGSHGCLVTVIRADVADGGEAGAAAAAAGRGAVQATGLLHAAGVQVRSHRQSAHQRFQRVWETLLVLHLLA